MKATWNNIVLAESNETIVVEGNHYFPPGALHKEHFKTSSKHTTCPWKGEASYYTLLADGHENIDAAWFYPSPKEAAAKIKNYIAFWKGVKVSE